MFFAQTPHWCGMMSRVAGLERHRRRPRSLEISAPQGKNGEKLSPPDGLIATSTHAPADDRRFDWIAGIHTVPSTATPCTKMELHRCRRDPRKEVRLAG